MNRTYVVQILVPKATGKGEPIRKECFEEFLRELTDNFGGATSYIRAPAQGLWRSGEATERVDIAIVEVMADKLATEFCARAARKELSQDEIVIRAQEIIPL